jgi:hypothetical protein
MKQKKLILNILIILLIFSKKAICEIDYSVYFPLSIGSKWTYVVTEKDKSFKVKAKVIGKKKLKGVECYLVEEKEKKETSKTYYQITKDGIYVLKIIKKIFLSEYDLPIEPKLLIMKFPLKKGMKWSWSGKFLGQKVTFKYEVLKRQKIKTKAGKFVCFPVSIKRYKGKKLLSQEIKYYSKNLGLVRHKGKTKIKILKSYKIKR